MRTQIVAAMTALVLLLFPLGAFMIVHQGFSLTMERERARALSEEAAIARAVLCPSEVLLLDEPFTGLDEETRLRTIRFVRQRRGDRLLLLTTHRPEEAELLGAETIRL